MTELLTETWRGVSMLLGFFAIGGAVGLGVTLGAVTVCRLSNWGPVNLTVNIRNVLPEA